MPITEQNLRRRVVDKKEKEGGDDKETEEEEEGKLVLADDSQNWNNAMRKVLRALPLVGLLAISTCMYHIWLQENAFAEWTAVSCEVHESAAKDVSRERKLATVRLRAEWSPKVTYSYLWEGRNYTSDKVYYFKKLTTTEERFAQQIVRAFRPGGRCRVYVNPDNPKDSLLVRKAWFRPYAYLCLAIASVIFIIWYAAVEHDWHAPTSIAYLPDKVTDGAQAEEWKLSQSGEGAPSEELVLDWFRVPFQVWLADPRTLALLGLLPVVWMAAAWLMWMRFTSGPHSPEGLEQIYIYLAGGAIMTVRWLYQVAMAARVGNPELCISGPQLTIGSQHIIRWRQRQRGGCGVTFSRVELALEMRETMRRPAEDRSKRSHPSTKIKFRSDLLLAKDETVPSTVAGLESKVHLTIPPIRVLKSSDTIPVRNTWYLTLKVKLAHFPFQYIESMEIDVKVPELYRDIVI